MMEKSPQSKSLEAFINVVTKEKSMQATRSGTRQARRSKKKKGKNLEATRKFFLFNFEVAFHSLPPLVRLCFCSGEFIFMSFYSR